MPGHEIECGVHPYAGMLAVVDLKYHALPIVRCRGIYKLRIPVRSPFPLLIRTEQRSGLIESGVNGEVKLGSDVRRGVIRVGDDTAKTVPERWILLGGDEIDGRMADRVAAMRTCSARAPRKITRL